MTTPTNNQVAQLPELTLDEHVAIDGVIAKWDVNYHGLRQDLKNVFATALEERERIVREEERDFCKQVYIDGVDWTEWGMNDLEAGESFEEEYRYLQAFQNEQKGSE